MQNNFPSTPAPVAAAALQNRHDLVNHLRKSALYRDYQQAFQTTTGLPMGVRASGSFQAPLQGSKQTNPFCALMAQRNKTCAACLQLQQRIEEGAGNGPKTLECFAGLSESAVPVRVGQDLLGYLQTGQVLLRAPTKAGFKRITRQLIAWGLSSDLKQLETAYFRTRVMTRTQYQSVVRLLAIFAQHLSSLSNQLMVQESAAEAPAVTKARGFIAEHRSEELTLSQVAQSVNMSAFYFCKIFKRATGLTFTDYLARTRVEGVKHLLLNPHTRVSEAAFEAGFQSLSQFNRVFRRIAGESPTAYRERLHGPSQNLPVRPSLAHAA